ncbi:VOC family protein [Jiulongibacter sediminis]|uniref:Glyoxalase n=1 Tax=Jiulongibacter sediminis TaxID=1605367 RepID=A0A0P7BUV6_9BACT|nr:VOC family protein [Jiulongibacter sediminis]KPM48472.1 glyoxalase [Jiulongibacter sediminis]TBX25011.1 glyoxalase [Jiulongibacter sediminis]
MKDNFSHSATIFPVKNIQESIVFYTQKLGFSKTFDWGEPVSYAVLKKGGVNIHLSTPDSFNPPSSEHCSLYIFVYNVQEIYEKCLSEGVKILNAPETRDYKMTDFDILDPDGYLITFGNGG